MELKNEKKKLFSIFYFLFSIFYADRDTRHDNHIARSNHLTFLESQWSMLQISHYITSSSVIIIMEIIIGHCKWIYEMDIGPKIMIRPSLKSSRYEENYSNDRFLCKCLEFIQCYITIIVNSIRIYASNFMILIQFCRWIYEMNIGSQITIRPSFKRSGNEENYTSDSS